ncbi:uncharacterized protein LOC124113530 isoform X3 [Haliotis rufescens]|uniref:uncharacterized protein LOC124113530 isoform X3 n=1 Tax=Haliotis rufescens TaxID=6454 RepID=UPI00201EC11B|nr:uncharacterized protein LOC124113530 isoform X3 [Haliotis rufescens]
MILIVMKSLVLLMLVFGTVAADANAKRIDDIKKNLQTKIKEAVPTDNFVKVLLDIDVEDMFKVLEQLPLEDRKKLCELMPPRRIVEYCQRLPVEDRGRAESYGIEVLLNDEEMAGKLDEFNHYFNKTSILQLYEGMPIPKDNFSFLGKHPEEIKKTLLDQKENYKLFDDLFELPLDQQMKMCKGFTLEKLRNVLKAGGLSLRDDYDIGRLINELVLDFNGAEVLDLEESQADHLMEGPEYGDLDESPGDNLMEGPEYGDLDESPGDNLMEGPEYGDLDESPGDNLMEGPEYGDLDESPGDNHFEKPCFEDLEETQEDKTPGDLKANGYEEPFFKQIIEIQLGKSKGINVEQTPEIQRKVIRWTR